MIKTNLLFSCWGGLEIDNEVSIAFRCTVLGVEGIWAKLGEETSLGVLAALLRLERLLALLAGEDMTRACHTELYLFRNNKIY